MNITCMSAGSWLLHSTVGGGLVLLVTCLLVRCTRQPARRQRLGEFGLAASLAVAVLSLGPAWVMLPWPTSSPPTAQPVAPAQPSAVDRVAGVADLMVAHLEGPGAADAAHPLFARVAEMPTPALEPAAISVDWREAVSACVVGLFVLGAAWTFARWLFGWSVVAALVRKARPAPSEVAALFAAMAPARLRARLLLSGRLRVPVSCGLVRPTVLVPASFCAASEHRRLRWVFAHELTHLERRDAWSALLFGLGQALFFPLPWFWWLRNSVRLCQEYVADAAAIAALGESPAEAPADYAEFLLSLTETPAVPLATTGVSGTTSDLYRRVLMLLEQPLRVERRCPRPWAWLTAAALLALGVLVAGVGLRADAAPAADGAQAAAQQQVEKNIKVIVVPGRGDARGIVVQIPDAADDKAKPQIFRIEKLHAAGDKAHRVVVIGHDAELETVRKALDKLEKDGRLKPEQVQEIRKALERTAKTLERTAKLRLELRTQKKAEDLPKEVQEALRKLHEQIEKAGGKFDADALRKQIEKALGKPAVLVPMPKPPQAPQIPALPNIPQPQYAAYTSWTLHGSGPSRLGIRVEKPSAALVDQLNLPKGQGLVIVEVRSGTPAAQATLRANDVLLKLADQVVVSDPAALAKIVEGLKADSMVAVVVLRKGQEVQAKLTLPQTKARRTERLGDLYAPVSPTARGSVVTTATRTGNNFTARHQEGSLIITVTGTVADGKATPTTITVQDGGTTQRFDNAGAVPAKYRDKVNHLIQISVGGSTRVESR